MPTTSLKPTSLDKLSWYLGHCPHTQWDRFKMAEKAQMVEEDLAAGRSVSAVLISLVTMGMVLSAVTLIAILLTS
jgi:hypothetical protein